MSEVAEAARESSKKARNELDRCMNEIRELAKKKNMIKRENSY
jgi:hypothetical protein